jgi:hypothetical protein
MVWRNRCRLTLGFVFGMFYKPIARSQVFYNHFPRHQYSTIFSEDMADGARFGSIAVANPFRRDGLAPRAKPVLGLE